jgi:hypothetical protein
VTPPDDEQWYDFLTDLYVSDLIPDRLPGWMLPAPGRRMPRITDQELTLGLSMTAHAGTIDGDFDADGVPF